MRGPSLAVSPPRRPTVSLLAAMAALLLLTSACAKVKPEPFTQFEASTVQASTMIASVAKRDISTLRKLYVTRQAENTAFSPAWVYLDYSGAFTAIRGTDLIQPTAEIEAELAKREASSGQSSSAARPELMLYPLAQENELTLLGLNASFSAYVKALGKLASDQAIPQSELDAAKAGFEKFLGNTSGSLPVLSKPGVSSGVSQLLTAGVQAFLEYKQRRDLIHVIDTWQPIVDEYAGACQTALARSSFIYHNEYQATFTALKTKLDQLILPRPPAKATKELVSERAKVIDAMLDANDKLLADFAGLAALYQYYGLVPAAHDALGKNLKKNIVDSSSLNTVYAYVKIIVELYKSLTHQQQPPQAQQQPQTSQP